jgi:hypothetical protein
MVLMQVPNSLYSERWSDQAQNVRIFNHRNEDPRLHLYTLSYKCQLLFYVRNVTYLPVPIDAGSGKDAVEPRFTMLLLDDIETLDNDLNEDLLDGFDFVHSCW